MKNSGEQRGCYPHYPCLMFMFAFSLFVFLLTQNNAFSSPGFLGQWFNNLQRDEQRGILSAHAHWKVLLMRKTAGMRR